jgi:hypothetical protein
LFWWVGGFVEFLSLPLHICSRPSTSPGIGFDGTCTTGESEHFLTTISLDLESSLLEKRAQQAPKSTKPVFRASGLNRDSDGAANLLRTNADADTGHGAEAALLAERVSSMRRLAAAARENLRED